MTNNVMLNEYGPTSRLLHWVTVLLVIIAWALGQFGEELLGEGEQASRGTAAGLNIHVWAGLAILMIAALRFPWRIANPPPPTEVNEFNRWLISWTDPAARLTHYALYLLLFVVRLLEFFSSSRVVTRCRCSGSSRSPLRLAPTACAHTISRNCTKFWPICL